MMEMITVVRRIIRGTQLRMALLFFLPLPIILPFLEHLEKSIRPNHPQQYYNTFNQFLGVYYTGSQTTINSITDGTSQTLGFGELLGGNCQGARKYVLAWMGAAGMGVGYDLLEPCQYYTFGSRHASVVQFAMCDGSVQRLFKVGPTSNTSSSRYIQLLIASGAQDGYVVDFSQIGGN